MYVNNPRICILRVHVVIVIIPPVVTVTIILVVRGMGVGIHDGKRAPYWALAV